MNALVKMVAISLLGSAVGSVEGRLQNAVQPIFNYAKRVGVGLSVVAAALVAWVIGLIFMLTALFFYLSEVVAYQAPAFWTGFISLGIALILFLLGINIIRQR